jgi:AhpD family alkylhydroperoxidase
MVVPPIIDFEFFADELPQAVDALRTLSQVASPDLDKRLIELIKVRASQINGCAYCLQLHLNWARMAGVPQRSLDRVAVWREAADFTELERAALTWTEALTDPARHVEWRAARHTLTAFFTPPQILRLTVAVAAVNAWNRIAGPLDFTPPEAE